MFKQCLQHGDVRTHRIHTRTRAHSLVRSSLPLATTNAMSVPCVCVFAKHELGINDNSTVLLWRGNVCCELKMDVCVFVLGVGCRPRFLRGMRRIARVQHPIAIVIESSS